MRTKPTIPMEDKEARVLAAAAELVAGGYLPSVENIRKFAGMSTVDLCPILRRLKERGNWPHPPVPMGRRAHKGFEFKRVRNLTDEEREVRILAVAADLDKIGTPFACAQIASKACCGATITRVLIRRLIERGEWPYKQLARGLQTCGTNHRKASRNKGATPAEIREAVARDGERREKKRAADLALVMGEHNPRLEASIIARAEWRRAVKGCEKLRDEVKRRLEAKHDRHFLPTTSVDCSGGRVGCAGDPGVDLVREGA